LGPDHRRVALAEFAFPVVVAGMSQPCRSRFIGLPLGTYKLRLRQLREAVTDARRTSKG
jgi:hypothetical protein